jgi:hypothetical protein
MIKTNDAAAQVEMDQYLIMAPDVFKSSAMLGMEGKNVPEMNATESRRRNLDSDREIDLRANNPQHATIDTMSLFCRPEKR